VLKLISEGRCSWKQVVSFVDKRHVKPCLALGHRRISRQRGEFKRVIE